jgi:transcriptional regulator with XRE-family HTH domain
MPNFHEAVRAIRQAKGLTQEQVAERAGVSAKHLGEIERGDGNPSLRVMLRLSRAIDLDLATLVGDQVARLSRHDMRAEAVQHLNRLADDSLRDIVRLLRLKTR